MERKIKKVAELFGEFSKYRKEVLDNLDMETKSGRYTKSYLNGLADKAKQGIIHKQTATQIKIAELKDEYMQEVGKKTNVLSGRIDTQLSSMLQSGIKLSKSEIADLAKKFNDYPNSRLIHDYAENLGYKLKNIKTSEDYEKDFDSFVRKIECSMDDNSIHFYDSGDSAMIAAENICKSMDSCSYDISESVDEELQNDIRHQKEEEANITDEIDNAFKDGFFTESELKAKQESVLNIMIAGLTQQERDDAEAMSLRYGNKGEITQKELDYLESKDYKDFCKKRETEEEKQNADGSEMPGDEPEE